MSDGIRNRINRLKSSINQRRDICSDCGMAGGVVLAMNGDDAVPVCVRCLSPREHPGYPLKEYDRELLEAAK